MPGTLQKISMKRRKRRQKLAGRKVVKQHHAHGSVSLKPDPKPPPKARVRARLYIKTGRQKSADQKARDGSGEKWARAFARQRLRAAKRAYYALPVGDRPAPANTLGV